MTTAVIKVRRRPSPFRRGFPWVMRCDLPTCVGYTTYHPNQTEALTAARIHKRGHWKVSAL